LTSKENKIGSRGECRFIVFGTCCLEGKQQELIVGVGCLVVSLFLLLDLLLISLLKSFLRGSVGDLNVGSIPSCKISSGVDNRGLLHPTDNRTWSMRLLQRLEPV
jgi:hypothetical protein